MATNNATNTGNPVTVAQGGTGLATLTAHSIQVGAGTANVTQLAVGATGTVVIGNTGADPSFSATPTVTSITFGSGNALNNYTEGSYTPTLIGAVSGTTTYTSQNGFYIRVGNLITVQAFIQITAATGTGDLTFGGLPFTVRNQTNGGSLGALNFNGSLWTWPVGRTSLSILGVLNTTTAVIPVSGSAVTTSNMQMTNAALVIRYTFTYEI